MIIDDIQNMQAEKLAIRFHTLYEQLAPSFGYETREASRTEWTEVPENNKKLMIAVCREIIKEFDVFIP